MVVFILVGLLNVFILFIGLAMAAVYLSYLYFVFRTKQKSASPNDAKRLRKLSEREDMANSHISPNHLKVVTESHNLVSPNSGIDKLMRSVVASRFEAESVEKIKAAPYGRPG